MPCSQEKFSVSEVSNIKLAFGSVPKDGGTFTFYRNQSKALKPLGIEMFCVALGAEQADLWENEYADDHCVLLAPKSSSIKKQSKAFVQWCIDNEINVVMGINSQAILSAIPHLPKDIRVVSRCANAFDHGYRITLSGGDRLSRIIALTPRLRDDLVNLYGADPKIIHLIPNGIDKTIFARPTQMPVHMEPIRIGFLGRLEHEQKGVLHIPHIVKALNELQVPFQLSIAGKGKHGAQLKEAMSKEVTAGQVRFLGALKPDQIPGFLWETDVYLFTSHFEGCPNALLEAMMASCVPVSWIIEGITDFLIEDGRTGKLIQSGDYMAAAIAIEALHLNRENLFEMRGRVQKEAVDRFTNEVCAAQYARILKEVMSEETKDIDPLSWDKFRPDPNFGKPRLSWLPYSLRKSIKKRLR